MNCFNARAATIRITGILELAINRIFYISILFQEEKSQPKESVWNVCLKQYQQGWCRDSIDNSNKPMICISVALALSN